MVGFGDALFQQVFQLRSWVSLGRKSQGGADGLSPRCRAGNRSRSFRTGGSELLGRAKRIPSAARAGAWGVCVAPLTEEGY